MLTQKGSILCGSVSGCWQRASETKGLAGERRGEAGGNFCGGAIDIIRQPPPNKYRLTEIEILLKQGSPAGWAKDTNTSKEKTLEPRKEVLMVLMDRIDPTCTESITTVASPWDGGVLSDQKQSKKTEAKDSDFTEGKWVVPGPGISGQPPF